MKVYIVFCCVAYEGSYVHSVHATKEGADAEAGRVKALRGLDHHVGCDKHTTEEYEVQP